MKRGKFRKHTDHTLVDRIVIRTYSPVSPSIQLFRHIQSEQTQKIQKHVIDQIMNMLRLSSSQGSAKNSKQQSSSIGFNKPDKKGDSVLSKALKHGMITLASQMIESGSLDLTAQQKATGLTPMHLIAHHIDDIATIQAIFRVIDVK